LSPDDRFAGKIREQGYGFVKYEPAGMPDTDSVTLESRLACLGGRRPMR
jgi:hypothetical protein